MNSFIETLNQWGENFLSFAWPMLWQSSLLIAVLFGLDLLFRRQLRAGVRYALWLVVLVKLCLPPTLAMPTSPAWWLHQAPPPAAAKPVSRYTVTYDSTPLPEIPQAALPTYVPPAPVMSLTAWLLVVSVAVSLVLFLWLLVRWCQVARMVRLAVAAEQFSEQLREAMRLVGAPIFGLARSTDADQLAGLKTGVPNVRQTSVRLKIVAGQISPAVCGLFRPTILIPQSLAENFSDVQLRAVLLHELIHLSRRDVWVNFLQALLQICYWWHPLVWAANARIRRVREEAVDDAVMLALRDDAECYAPTLLEVAKLALDRPLVSLGLVGIMESRHALRQRIERLVDFRAPRHAGLTLVSLLGILAFTAVAVPMGEGPAEQRKSLGSLGQPEVTTTSGHNIDHVESVVGHMAHSASDSQNTNSPTILVTAHFFHMSGVDFQNIFSTWKFKRDAANLGSWVAVWPQPFSSILSQLKSSGLKQFSAPRAVTISGNAVTMSIGNGTNEINFNCTPVATNGQVNLAFFYRLVEAQAGSLMTNQFQAAALLQNQGGVVVCSADVAGKSASNLVALVSAEIVTDSARFQQRLNSAINRTNGALTYTGPGRQLIIEKLNRIRLDSVIFDDVPLSEVLRQLSEKSRQADPERKGINFLIDPNAEQSGPAIVSRPAGMLAGVNPATGLPVTPAGGAALDVGQFTVKLNLTNVRLTDVLAAIMDMAQNPNPGDPRKISYAIKDYGIVFQPKSVVAPQLFTREFKVDTNIFLAYLRREARVGDLNSATNLTGAVFAAFRAVCTNAGVNLDAPPGKSVFYNDRSGKFLVRATMQDLDVIEEVIHKLNSPPPSQIHIKARFLELPRGAVAGFNQLLGQQVPVKPVPTTSAVADMVNGSPVVRPGASGAVPVKPVNAAQLVGILTRTNFISMLRALEARGDVENLGEPEVTTLNGRQTQMRVTQVLELVTNLVYQEDATNGPIVPQMGKVETGPVLDVVPYVLSDGYTINLALIPSLTKFLGYDKSTNTPVGHNRAGDKFNMPTVLPRFAIRQAVATVNLWDDQTAVICGIPETINVNGSAVTGIPKSSDKELLVFITATIVDPAGNRVHSDKDLPFAQKGVPEQPKQK